jgi:hypothetical protein
MWNSISGRFLNFLSFLSCGLLASCGTENETSQVQNSVRFLRTPVPVSTALPLPPFPPLPPVPPLQNLPSFTQPDKLVVDNPTRSFPVKLLQRQAMASLSGEHYGFLFQWTFGFELADGQATKVPPKNFKAVVAVQLPLLPTIDPAPVYEMFLFSRSGAKSAGWKPRQVPGSLGLPVDGFVFPLNDKLVISKLRTEYDVTKSVWSAFQSNPAMDVVLVLEDPRLPLTDTRRVRQLAAVKPLEKSFQFKTYQEGQGGYSAVFWNPPSKELKKVLVPYYGGDFLYERRTPNFPTELEVEGVRSKFKLKTQSVARFVPSVRLPYVGHADLSKLNIQDVGGTGADLRIFAASVPVNATAVIQSEKLLFAGKLNSGNNFSVSLAGLEPALAQDFTLPGKVPYTRILVLEVNGEQFVVGEWWQGFNPRAFPGRGFTFPY